MEAILETTKMSTKGQVIIPKGTRKFIKAGRDTVFAVFPLDKGTVVLKKIERKEILDEFRKLRAGVRKRLSEGEINEIVHKVRQN
ncbi:MAG: hypothetical protein ABID38_04820 [Candidatus Diapherotrites archaeon]